MSDKLLCVIAFVITMGCGNGCGPIVLQTENTQDAPILTTDEHVETSTAVHDTSQNYSTEAPSVDTFANMETELILTGCDKVCGSYDFTDECRAVCLLALPVGENLIGKTCLERCESMERFYEEASNEFDYNCLALSNDCDAVAQCLNVAE